MYDPSLGRAHRGRLEHALLHHPGLEKSFDQVENGAVGHFRGHAGHDDLMRQVVEEPLPEMLPSLKRRLVGERRSHRRVTGPFRIAYGSGLPGLRRDGVGLSPVSVVSRCTQARPPVAWSVRSVEPSHGAARGRGRFLFREASAGLGAWPTDPAETRPLPSYSCLAPPSPSIAGRCWLRRLPVGSFEQAFPHGDGPARVGLSGLGVAGPPHRLRLSRPHLRLTPSPKRE